jgi:hypothetical protein
VWTGIAACALAGHSPPCDPRHASVQAVRLRLLAGPLIRLVCCAQAFVDAVQAMTPADIMQLRDSLANMGLEHTPTV